MSSKPSWGLRSVLQARDIAVNYICYAVGKEDEIDLWHFPWHPDGKISTQIPKSTTDPCLADEKMLSDIRRSDGWHPILDNDSLREEKLLLNRGIFIHDNKNIPIWKPSLDGSFSTHSDWDNIRHHSPKIPWFKTFWFIGHIPKHSLTVWRALQNKLLTKGKLCTYLPHIDTRCNLCQAHAETVDHLFFQCGYSCWIWRFVLWKFNSRRKPRVTLKDEEEWIRINRTGKGQAVTALKIAFASAIFRIWKERNYRQFQNKKLHKSVILRMINADVKERINWLQFQNEDSEEKRNTALLFGYKFNAKQPSEKNVHLDPPQPLKSSS
ncbi:uncharacterized protein LOC143850478 [Tasmannia lanceolata]|uniref:uncharacterized protein LOC143850478 n=1 Tax=Tasmannia lanceolata TaxID=3420 RepID=UPI0040633064